MENYRPQCKVLALLLAALFAQSAVAEEPAATTVDNPCGPSGCDH